MARMMSVFILVWIAVVFGIEIFRSLSGREKWQWVKTLTYGAVCAIIAFVLLMALVILF